jgi:hypothetical protein
VLARVRPAAIPANPRSGAERAAMQSVDVPMNMRNAVHVALIATSAVLVLPMHLPAQPGKLGTVVAIDGSVTVTRQGAVSVLALRDDVLIGDHVMTADQSMVRIRFVSDATMSVRARSVVTLIDDTGMPIADVERGTVYYRAPSGLGPDDVTRLRTPNASADSTGELSITVSGAFGAVVETTVCARDRAASAAARDGTRVDVPEGNCVTVSGETLGTVVPLPQLPRLPPLPYVL